VTRKARARIANPLYAGSIPVTNSTFKGNYMATKPKKPMPDDDKGKKPGKKPYK